VEFEELPNLVGFKNCGKSYSTMSNNQPECIDHLVSNNNNNKSNNNKPRP